MWTGNQNSFFRKLRDLLILPVDLGAVLRELFTNPPGSFPDLLRRNSRPWKQANISKVRYVRGWIVLMK
jgi:hypothetical protein